MWSDRAVFVLIYFNIDSIFGFTINTNLNKLEQKSVNRSANHILLKDNETYKNYPIEHVFDSFTTNIRQKRQSSSGAGKFTEAADMDQMKILRLYLQLFKNLFTSSYIGGAHPLHPDVPKPVIYLFKQRITDFFFPPVGVDAIKEK